MRKILLPTDFSANARNAIDYALHIFEKEACIFYVLNSYQVSTSRLSNTMNRAKDTRIFRAIRQESERNVHSLVKELETKNENELHKFEGLSSFEPLLDAIGRTTIDKNVSYIFMGTKGSSALKEVFMGSSTVKVLKNINFCPIIAVPEDYRYIEPEEIIFATNFEHVYSKVELIPLIEIAKLWNSKVKIVHVDMGTNLSQPQKTSRGLLKERLKELPLEFREIEGARQISDTIAEYAKGNKNIGIIAMVNYWHSFFEKLIKEEVVKKVAFTTEVPFLILPLID